MALAASELTLRAALNSAKKGPSQPTANTLQNRFYSIQDTGNGYMAGSFRFRGQCLWQSCGWQTHNALATDCETVIRAHCRRHGCASDTLSVSTASATQTQPASEPAKVAVQVPPPAAKPMGPAPLAQAPVTKLVSAPPQVAVLTPAQVAQRNIVQPGPNQGPK